MGAHLDFARVVSGNLARNGLRGLLKLIVAGQIGPHGLGVLRSVAAMFRITASVFDLGLDYAMVTLASAAIRAGDERGKRAVFKATLVLKAATVAVLLVGGNLAAEPLTRWLLNDPSLTLYTRLVFLAVGGHLSWKYISSYFSAQQQFDKVSLLSACMPAMMLASALVLLPLGLLSLHAALLIYLLAPPVTAVLWWPAINAGFIKERHDMGPALRRVARFSGWVYGTEVAYTARNEVNPLLLKNPGLSGSVQAGELHAGLYGFGSDLAEEISVVSQSLVTVLLPKASGTAHRDLGAFVRGAYGTLALIIVPLALLLLLAEPGIRLLGLVSETYLEYLPAVPVFMILFVAGLLSLAAIPMRMLFFSLELPHVETKIGFAMVFVVIALSLLLIPRYGAVGAAVAILVQRVVFLTVLSVIGLAKLRGLRGQR